MLHFTVSGNGRHNLVLLHGFMENQTIWEEMEKFFSKDFNWIKIDLPGHGLSKNYQKIHSMEFMAEKVKEVIDYLGIKNIHLLGHSMGGYVGLAFAENYPSLLNSLTLFFSTTLEDDDEKKVIRKRSLAIIDENLETFIHASIPNLFSDKNKKNLEDKIAIAIKIAKATDKEGAKAAQMGMMARPNRTSVLENLNVKILIIAGTHDKALKNELLLKIIPDRKNIKTHVLDCGHNGHWEQPILCTEIINKELLHV